MMDSVPTTSTEQDVQPVRRGSEPDACGFQKRKSTEMPVAKAPVPEDSNEYNMEHLNRGTCLVFNHTNYGDQQPQRMGTYVDVKRIRETFGALGFTVDVCDDFKYDEIKKKIKEVSKQDHTDNDCLCIIVLTHGKNDSLIYAKDGQYPLNVLWEPFTANNCLSLAGKPKLFFISACRGDKRDGGIRMEFYNKCKEGFDKRTETDGIFSTFYVIPVEADFLFGFSTPPGYCSWRSLQDGTWYIQSLCDVLDEYATRTDLVDILTKTAQEVTKRSSFHDADKSMHNQKQVPEFQSRLLRRVYFTSKAQREIALQNPPQRETAISKRAEANSKQEDNSTRISSQSSKSKSSQCNFL